MVIDFINETRKLTKETNVDYILEMKDGELVAVGSNGNDIVNLNSGSNPEMFVSEY